MLVVARDGQGAAVQPGMPTAGSQVRPLAVEDIPGVADLFRRIFVSGRRRGSRSLEDQLKREFFEHPWADPELPSLVFAEADGRVTGFIGVRPLRLRWKDTVVRGAVGGSLMVEEPEGNPLPGARLLRSFLAGPQDVSLSESANTISQSMWEKVGGVTEPAYSMEWLRVFRPGGLALTLASERIPVARLMRPPAAVVDHFAGRLRPSAVRPGFRSADVDATVFVEAMLALSTAYELRPDWDTASLSWFLVKAAEKERFGPPVHRLVLDRKGVVAGAYLYCARPGGVALVLQILSRPGDAEAVVDDLLADAAGRGVAAARGRVQPELADVLLRRRAVFVHSSSMVVHARRPELLGPIRSAQALITGIACESWSGLIGGLFR